ncbi:hypothetical protein GUITHDRAFT_100827 [Guillardia theta CCMP2712]|uniref:Uncharacterized protein n=1 Tax=Guillardia theta (strain CCMP2712) TaxID=905079 RepID=L1JZ71_GUITC|nr:hypothetical protein GUITHDRAFT_100827 [Guillardia theta CCMP2712]EKX53861.1 hypothetical protein GUITHDRAFT_100827 [Guillardia theta CCMP2712]|eukprot:XP_005840841.1 hypothetical protein GUITHDRAFT_100827 [Guillardia theta CCMP2712]
MILAVDDRDVGMRFLSQLFIDLLFRQGCNSDKRWLNARKERESAQRREEEIEALQGANAEEIANLSETLRKAEQARRESEIQLHPLQQRETELAEEMNRQKEKERLRKEYIEELKKRHEEEKNRLEQLFLKEQAGRREDQVLRLSAESNLSKIQTELSRLREYELARKELEEECKAKIDDENSRMKEIFQVSDQMRMTLRDIELKMSRAYADYFNIAPYESAVENEAEEAEDLFLA